MKRFYIDTPCGTFPVESRERAEELVNDDQWRLEWAMDDATILEVEEDCPDN